MEAKRFDAWTRRLAAGTPRRRVLAGLGAALAVALGLGGGERAAAAACDEAMLTCQQHAADALEAAQRACRAGPRAAEAACLLQADGAWAAATLACGAAVAQCGRPCKEREAICTKGSQCCSGRCIGSFFDFSRCA